VYVVNRFFIPFGDQCNTFNALTGRGQTLEQLMGSLTLVGAVGSAIELKAFLSFRTLGLLLLWTFSPLASQALIRGAYIEQSQNISEVAVQFPEHPPLVGEAAISSQAETLYAAALLNGDAPLHFASESDPKYREIIKALGGTDTVLKSSTTDQWGNIRIPVLRRQPNYNPEDPAAWLDIDWWRKMPKFASLVGVPVLGTVDDFPGELSFEITTHYFTMKASFGIT
jgi:hypothetical protein